MFALLALPWLALCTWDDLRTRTVPASLTIPPLVVAMAWHGYSESWPVALLAVRSTTTTITHQRQLEMPTKRVSEAATLS
jgi:Flp pilus assembly protein protease CpaA